MPPELRKLACSRRLVAEHARSMLRSRSAPGPLARPKHRGFARFDLRGRRSILARSGADVVASAALSQGQVFPIARFELRRRRITFERSGTDFVASTALSQGQVQNLWQVQPFRQVRYRRSTFARSCAEFVALSQGQLQNSWQAQHFRKVKCRIRGRRSTFARSSKDFVARGALSRS